MICPKCKGKTRVMETLPAINENAVFRRRRCKECKLSFHTKEAQITYDEDFREADRRKRRS